MALYRKCLVSAVVILLTAVAYFPVRGQTPQGGVPGDLVPITAANVTRLSEVALFDTHSGAPIPNLVWSADSQTLYSGGKNTNTVIAWDIASGSKKFTLDAEYSAFAVSSDSASIAVDSSSDLGGLTIYDAQTQTVKGFLHCSGGTLQIAFSPTNSKLLVVSTEGGNTRPPLLDFWFIKPTMQIDTTYAEPCNLDHRVSASGGVPFILFNPNGQFLLYGTHLLDVNTFKQIAILKDVPDDAVSAAAFSADGKLLATNVYGSNKIMIWSSLWSLQNNHPVGAIDLTQDPTITGLTIWGLAFSPNGQLLVVGGYGTIRGVQSSFVWVWDARSYTPITVMQGQENGEAEGSLAFSPDGKRLAVADTVIHIYGVPK